MFFAVSKWFFFVFTQIDGPVMTESSDGGETVENHENQTRGLRVSAYCYCFKWNCTNFKAVHVFVQKGMGEARGSKRLVKRNGCSFF